MAVDNLGKTLGLEAWVQPIKTFPDFDRVMMAHSKEDGFCRQRFGTVTTAVVHKLTHDCVSCARIGHNPLQVGALKVDITQLDALFPKLFFQFGRQVPGLDPLNLERCAGIMDFIVDQITFVNGSVVPVIEGGETILALWSM